MHDLVEAGFQAGGLCVEEDKAQRDVLRLQPVAQAVAHRRWTDAELSRESFDARLVVEI
jgi:hypothetical protein